MGSSSWEVPTHTDVPKGIKQWIWKDIDVINSSEQMGQIKRWFPLAVDCQKTIRYTKRCKIRDEFLCHKQRCAPQEWPRSGTETAEVRRGKKSDWSLFLSFLTAEKTLHFIRKKNYQQSIRTMNDNRSLTAEWGLNHLTPSIRELRCPKQAIFKMVSAS